MSRTSNLRRQHDTALQIIANIQAELSTSQTDIDADTSRKVSMLVAKLTGLLRIHFIQEDKALYPSLIASDRGDVAAVARRFFAEMGTLGPVYHQFAEKWSSAGAISAAPGDFRRESEGVFAALGERIARENTQLYPLADTLEGDWSFRAA